MLVDPEFTENSSSPNPVTLDLLDAAVEIAGEVEITQALPKILQFAAQLCRSDGEGVLFLEPECGEITHYLGYRTLGKIPLPVSGSDAIQRIQDTAGPLCLESESIKDYFPGSAIPGRVMLEPVREQEKTIGLLIIHRRKSEMPFDSADGFNLKALARFAAVALENARAFDEIREHTKNQERYTLAKSLHSGAAQTLFLLGMEAEIGLDLQDVLEIRQHMITLRRLAVRAGEELRGLIAAMRSRQEIQQNPLVPLLQKRLNNFHAQTDIPVALYASILPASIPASVIETVYRMIIEYLDTLTHQTGIAAVIVRLNTELGKLVIEIRDVFDGKHAGVPMDSPDLSQLGHIIEEINGGTFAFGQTEDEGRFFIASLDLFS